MKDRWKHRTVRNKGYRRIGIMILFVLLILSASAAGVGITEAKSQNIQKISKGNISTEDTRAEDMREENYGAYTLQFNPLYKERYPEVSRAVEEYYAKLKEGQDFVESYDNIEVYTKAGKYKDTYIVFARYGMKIKDIYTEVPGLETLYVDRSVEDGAYQVLPTADSRIEIYIKMVAGHQDVQTLLAETEAEYRKALQSDALLREVLSDLHRAYGDSASDK